MFVESFCMGCENSKELYIFDKVFCRFVVIMVFIRVFSLFSCFVVFIIFIIGIGNFIWLMMWMMLLVVF